MGETGILGTGPDICPTSGTDSLRARPGSPGGLLRPTPPPRLACRQRTELLGICLS